MSETLKLQRNASIYTKRRQMRKAATRTVQVGVSCFGARQTGLASTGRGRRAGWEQRKERVREKMVQTEVRGERGEEGWREGKRKGGRGRDQKREKERKRERLICTKSNR